MDRQLLRQLSAITQEERRLLDGGTLEREKYTDSRRFVVDSEKLLHSGKLITIRSHTRFVDFPDHTHNYVELVYMASGSTTHIIDGNITLQVKAGELLFLNQHVRHAVHRAAQEDVAINFIVLPAFFGTALEMIGTDNVLGRFLAGSLQKGSGEVSFLHFAVSDILPVQNLVEGLVWGLLNEQPNGRRINQISIGLLFLHLLNYTERLQIPSRREGTNALVLEALREVEENYRDANLSAIAQRRHVSLAYMSRLVREATGYSYKHLLQQKRMSKAGYLLRETNLAVQEVVAAVGYENTSYFYRLFQREFGLSPRAYRMQNQVK